MKIVRKISDFLKSDSLRQWLARLVLPTLAILMLILLTHLYNFWNDLLILKPVRRSIATFALGALLFGPAVVFRARAQATYLAVVSWLVGCLFVANAVYAAYAGGFLSASSLSYVWQVGDVGGSIKGLLKLNMVAFLIPGVMFTSLALIWNRLGARLQWGRLGWKGATAVTAGIVLSASLGYGYAAYKQMQTHGDLALFLSHPFDATVEVVPSVGILNYNLLDAVKYFGRQKSITASEVEFIKKHRDSQLSSSGPNEATGLLAGRNVIFLQLESFQQFLIGLRVNGQEITPNLNKLAAEGRQYTHFNYAIGPGTSSDAEFSTFNSLLPLANESVVFDYPANDYHAYPDQLRKQDYTTHAYHADSRNFWNRGNTFPVFGFDKYTAEEGYPKGKVIGLGLNDIEFLEDTADMIAGLKQPFYAHTITLSSHTPFVMPADEQSLDLSGVGINKLQKDYLQSVHYTDEAIGKFLDRLEKHGLKDKMALFVMGDHEGFIFRPEDKAFAKFLGYGQGFNDRTALATRAIPFLIYAPGSSLSGVDERPASQIDIYPTLLNLLGIKKPDTVLGVDLFGDQQPTVVRRYRGIGASIDTVERGELMYTGSGVKGGKPVCYRGAEPVDMKNCDDLREFAVARALLSDYVIKGNRLDLLNPVTK